MLNLASQPRPRKMAPEYSVDQGHTKGTATKIQKPVWETFDAEASFFGEPPSLDVPEVLPKLWPSPKPKG